MQRSINFLLGRLLAAALFRFKSANGDSQSFIFLSVHHLVIDTVSWAQIVDFVQNYLDLKPGRPSIIHPKMCFCESVNMYITEVFTTSFSFEKTFWAEILRRGGTNRSATKYRGNCLGLTTTLFSFDYSVVSQLSESLSKGERQFRPFDVLLGIVAFVTACPSKRDGQLYSYITLESHGRSGESSVRSQDNVGWYTALFPLVMNVSLYERLQLGSFLECIICASTAYRFLPVSETSYNDFKYLGDCDDFRASAAQLEPEIVYNHLGHIHHADSLATSLLAH